MPPTTRPARTPTSPPPNADQPGAPYNGRPMRIVVIGGTGRIGEFVVRELLNPSDGGPWHTVTVVSRAGGTPIPGAQYALADVLDLGQTIGAVAGADAIIQLAAVTRRRGVA